jgi:LytTr DNA-binding domain-containing protein
MHIFPHAKIERNKVKYLLTIVAVWTAFGLFFGTQNYIRDAYAGRPASLPGYIVGWIFCGYSWGILTIPVLRFIRRFSLSRLGWGKFALIQLAAAAIFSLAQLGIYLFIAGVLFREAGQDLWGFYKFLLANELQSSILVYFAIVASVTVYDRFFRTQTAAISPLVENVDQNGHHHNLNGTTNGLLRRLSVKENGRIVLLDIDQIEWIESYGNYLFLHTPDGKHIHRETMTAIEQKLDPAEFVRIRRSAIVKVDRIRELRPIENGEFEVVLENGRLLSSTRRYKKNLESILRF